MATENKSASEISPEAQRAPEKEIISLRTPPCIAIADLDGRIVAAYLSNGDSRHDEFAELLGGSSEKHYRPVRAVQEAIRTYLKTRSSNCAIAFVTPTILLRLLPIDGREISFVAVLFERFSARETLATAAARYGISNREGEVLRLLLGGRSMTGIAKELHITESTVQGHVKRALSKTGSKSRTEMIAKLLSWSPDLGTSMLFLDTTGAS